MLGSWRKNDDSIEQTYVECNTLSTLKYTHVENTYATIKYFFFFFCLEKKKNQNIF